MNFSRSFSVERFFRDLFPLAGKALLVVLLFSLAAGCAYQSASLRHKPVNLPPFSKVNKEGKVLYLFMWVTPRQYGDFFLEADLPGGKKALIYPANALLISYKEAFSAFFEVSERYRYSDFTAHIPLGEMEFSVSYTHENPAPGEEVTMDLTVSYTVITVDNHTTLPIQNIRPRKQRRVTFPYAGASRTLERIAFLLEDLFAEMESDLYEEIEAGREVDKYKVWR